MQKIIRLLRYDWPLHFVLLLTNWLPDNTVFLRFRGYLARFFIGKCGRNIMLGRNVVFYNPVKINIGNDIYIAFGSWLSADGEIIIQDEVTIGPYCVIAASDHKRVGRSFFNSSVKSEDIHIGKGCWIGAHCVITAGSSIGEGSLLGAGAVCSGSIPNDVLAGGVPARVIKQLDGDSN